jgi:glutaredoxin 3
MVRVFFAIVVLLATLLGMMNQRTTTTSYALAPPRYVGQKRLLLTRSSSSSSTSLHGMKRPLLDQIATTLFRLETARVEASSETDEKGRVGEPMEWSRDDSLANQFSEFMAKYGYGFKQFVADIVAGNDYNKTAVNEEIDHFINENPVAMFSFTSCPFCRRAKDALEERGIKYKAMELDELPGNKQGNIILKGRYIGGCNDGSPGLLPLLESGELEVLLLQ